MDELLMALRIVLANKFVMYFKAHSYHWNVESDRFAMLHDFFGDIYQDIHGSTDEVAERIRIINAYAPISIMELYNYKLIDEDSTKPASCTDMVLNLIDANTKVIDSLNKLFEIAEAQKLDASLKKLEDQYSTQLVKSIEILCKDGKMVIPKALQHRAVSWYHHYLQHPGNTRLKETLKAAMYWKHMRSTVRSYVKNCRSCQVNKRRSLKYGKLPTKLATITPWEAVCVDLIGPYTLRGKDGTEIDFMCLTIGLK
jgi:starvation-inducible DNA-binding protein